MLECLKIRPPEAPLALSVNGRKVLGSGSVRFWLLVAVAASAGGSGAS
jgi:hypothetical protein